MHAMTHNIPYAHFAKQARFGQGAGPQKQAASVAETPRGDDVFCRILRNEMPGPSPIIGDKSTMSAVLDRFPVSPGHVLIFPKRHIPSFFDTNAQERNDLWSLLTELKTRIERACVLNKQRVPDAYNIGINDGPAAGQTVRHLHVHLIPRYKGDMADPTGGVRGVIPEKQAYDRNAPVAPEVGLFEQMLQSTQHIEQMKSYRAS